MPVPTFSDNNILYAAQLNQLAAAVPTKVSQLVNDMNFITSSGGAVTSVAGKGGTVTLTYQDIGGLSVVAHSGIYSDLANLPTIPTNNNQIANGAGYLTAASITGYAQLSGANFTGNVTTPTPVAGDNTTKVATTAFVTTAISGLSSGGGSGSVSNVTSTTTAITVINGSTAPQLTFVPGVVKTSTLLNDANFITTAALSGYATLASPALTGNATATTQSTSDNSNKIATTAFVQSLVPVPVVVSGAATSGLLKTDGIGDVAVLTYFPPIIVQVDQSKTTYGFTVIGSGGGLTSNGMVKTILTGTGSATVTVTKNGSSTWVYANSSLSPSTNGFTATNGSFTCVDNDTFTIVLSSISGTFTGYVQLVLKYT